MSYTTVIIAEKPELCKAIVSAVFPGATRKEGFYDCGNGIAATHCVGHFLELDEPEQYDIKLKPWRHKDLPIYFPNPNRHCKANCEKQYKVVDGLISSAQTIIHAGDPDDEGQTIVDELLQINKDFHGTVKRLLINDNTPALVKKAWDNMRPNEDFALLSQSAQARQYADWLYGINLTRLYRVAAQNEGFSTLITDAKGQKKNFSIGRVETPILGLIVNRTRANRNHQKSIFYKVSGIFQFAGIEFPALYQTTPDDPTDSEGRLTNADCARRITEDVRGQTAKVISVDTKIIKDPAPLPYNLLKLQADASKLYGMKPDYVLSITQGLRDNHKAITYNRSDCQYLSEEQHANAPELLNIIAQNDVLLAPAVAKTDANIKSRAFNSKKISAHHAIIPQQTAVDFGKLSADEQTIYHLIARAYVAQFMPPAEYEQTKATLSVARHTFVCTTSIPVASGWKSIYGASDFASEDGEENEKEEIDISLKNLPAGATGICAGAKTTQGTTKPLPLYTMASLLIDLTRCARYIKDGRIRNLLIEKDKGKEGESGGIGTPATRHAIIAKLFDQSLICETKKGETTNIIPTEQGYKLFDILPENVTSVDLTALWFDEQKQIQDGTKRPAEFFTELMQSIQQICDDVTIKNEGSLHFGVLPKCPKCGKAMWLKETKDGKRQFWGCSGYPDCDYSAPDENGKPGTPKEKAKPDDNAPTCPNCGRPMIKRSSQNGEFWGCSGYPDCKTIMGVGDDGQPVAKQPKEKMEIPSDAPTCPKCGKPMVMRTTKDGTRKFWSCTGYPKCSYSAPDENGKPGTPKEKAKPDKDAPACPNCGKPMIKRKGKNGEFWGCSAFPKCKGIVNIEQ